MKLKALEIENFRGIKEKITVLIDNIVVLIGPNNSSKSSVLDAYEAYVSLGSALDEHQFHVGRNGKPVSITGIFCDLSEHDLNTIGHEWLIEKEENFGNCAKFRICWEKPGERGKKYSFSGKSFDWIEGGAGGFNSLLQSRLPTPVRVNPRDTYNNLEKVLKDLISKSATQKLKNDKSRLSRIEDEIRELGDQIERELSTDLGNINHLIQEEMQKIFPTARVSFKTDAGKFKIEDSIKDGSRFFVSTGLHQTPLENQGTGVKRAFLWSAINALCQKSMYKKGTKPIPAEDSKVLLIDEPEINLHPSLIRLAREAIYALADNAGWQVICTTHSPVFVDLAQDHTTLIRMASEQSDILYFQTDKAAFSSDEKENLKALNFCCPTINEFFFYPKSLLVEGESEYLAFQYLINIKNLSSDICVINCRGKANIPTFIKILTQFKSYGYAIHDLDTRKTSTGKYNAMWTINYSIREEADKSNGRVKTVVHSPDFERYYLNEQPTRDKPYNIFKHLSSTDFLDSSKYEKLNSSISLILENNHPGHYENCKKLEHLALLNESSPCPECKGKMTIDCPNCKKTNLAGHAQCETCLGTTVVEASHCPVCRGYGYQQLEQ